MQAVRFAEQLVARQEQLGPGEATSQKAYQEAKQQLTAGQSELTTAEVQLGLILSVLIIFLFLRTWGTTLVATLVIPVTILITLVVMRFAGLTFNLMTLGGIAAAVGLVIDDAIVVVEAIHAKMAAGLDRVAAVQEGIGEIFRPLIGSTLTPVVVFIPLAFSMVSPASFFARWR
jgi:multidrug efflux pump subunit AcrB